ncbi:MMPL family transporter [Quadrisphaera sp. DSM 44207]|uniref:MMPL family transporter n=1 Tax=Quadrisphaera sp. DSM 44207 TaxID=1881057 RepID=UPI000884FD85|nr:MMPL family transporter [Quadrisphaera sp. DSM 44207]SDQ32546.1 putative drug exporter of the RND superfamily [Quadrisphaera sp. DSM 44207]
MTTSSAPGEHPSPRPSPRRAVARAGALLAVLGVWLALAGVGGPLVGRLSEVQRNDNASFLPEEAESSAVSERAGAFAGSDALPFFVVLEREGGLAASDAPAVQQWIAGLPDVEVEVADADPVPLGDLLADEPVVPVPSRDGAALLVPVPLDAQAAGENLPDGEPALFGAAQALRTSLAADVEAASPGLQAWVTGPGGVLADFVTAFAGIDGRLLQVSLAVVFVILLLVYRSPLLPVAALLAALFALAAAGALVYPLADAGAIDINGQSQGILFILVVGAATDYALLLVARYREELHEHPSKYTAMRRAWRASLEPIAASAATVVLGLLCLLLADLGSTRGLGPVGAIGIVAALVSSLTLLPVLLLVPVVLLLLVALAVAAGAGAALAGAAGAAVGAAVVVLAAAVLAALRWRALHAHGRHVAGGHDAPWYARAPSGRWLFWPRVPHLDHAHSAGVVGARGLWGRVSSLVGRRPRAVWVLTLAALLGLAAFVPQFEADGVEQTDVFRDRVESVVGQEVLLGHFPGGSGTPALVLADEADLPQVLEVVTATDGVQAAVATSAAPAAPGAPPGPPLVVDGTVQVQATLQPPAGSPEAEDVVADLRTRLDAVGTDVLVGGQTASNLDVREASERDLRVIVPAVLAVILVVLVLLLRSLVAPVLLVAANVLSFAATIGASAILFGDAVLDLPGGDPAIPLYGFVFLVALGIDYSIFLTTRVREESVARGTRPGTLVGLAVTGGVITSAGVVLASTFGALATIPILFLLQIAVIVALGVLLDTLVVRSLLVPAAVYDIGSRVWWPSRLSREHPEAGEEAGEEARERPREPVRADG